MRKKSLTKQVGVILNDESHDKLIQITDTQEIPISKFIRQIVEEKLDSIDNQGKSAMTPANKYQHKLNQLVEQLSKPDSVIKFFKDSGIAEITKIQDINSYTRADGRRGLVMNVIENDDSEISQIIIDVKHGNPPSTSFANVSASLEL